MKYSLDLRHRLGLEMVRSLRAQKVGNHPLSHLFWECTLRCNLRCRHCGSDCKAAATVRDMPREDFLSVLEGIRKVYDPHKILVILTGGEPLMRGDLEECGRAIYDLGFPWGMVTNGYALTRERFKGLLESGLHSLTISLDGLEGDHDWMRGREGSFSRAADAIEMVCRYNSVCLAGDGVSNTAGLTCPSVQGSRRPDLPDGLGFSGLKPSDAVEFDVVTCVNRRSYAHLSEIKELLLGLGLRSWRLFTIFPVGRGAQDPELQLSGEEFRGLLDFIKETRREGRIMAEYGCEGFLGNYEGDVRDRFFYCGAGLTIGSVLADGSISACPSIRSDFSQGNIYKDDFVDVWEHRFSPFRDRIWMRRGECGECRFWRYCLGNGMHLRDAGGNLILCHLSRLEAK